MSISLQPGRTVSKWNLPSAPVTTTSCGVRKAIREPSGDQLGS